MSLREMGPQLKLPSEGGYGSDIISTKCPIQTQYKIFHIFKTTNDLYDF